MIKGFVILLFLSPIQAQWVKQEAQVVHSKKVTLNYIRAINPRFKSMSDKQIDIYFKEASRVCKEHFNLEITFIEKDTLTVASLFSSFSASFKKELNTYIYDFKNQKGDRNKLLKSMLATLMAYSKKVPFREMVDFSKDFILSEKNYTDFKSFADVLIQTQMKRLTKWTQVLASDKKPIIDESFYNEWTYWDGLGYEKRNYDIIISNQIIASAEYYGQDIHSALRGGIVAGTTTYAKGSPFGSLVFATSFLFLNNSPMIVHLRGGKIYSEDEAARYAGAYLAHELGHMLLALGHPFNRDACVMSPAKLLLFDKWYKNIDAKKCKLGSDKSMTPGDVELYYNNAW